MSLHGGVKEKKKPTGDIGDVKKTQEANPPQPKSASGDPQNGAHFLGPDLGPFLA